MRWPRFERAAPVAGLRRNRRNAGCVKLRCKGARECKVWHTENAALTVCALAPRHATKSDPQVHACLPTCQPTHLPSMLAM